MECLYAIADVLVDFQSKELVSAAIVDSIADRSDPAVECDGGSNLIWGRVRVGIVRRVICVHNDKTMNFNLQAQIVVSGSFCNGKSAVNVNGLLIEHLVLWPQPEFAIHATVLT